MFGTCLDASPGPGFLVRLWLNSSSSSSDGCFPPIIRTAQHVKALRSASLGVFVLSNDRALENIAHFLRNRGVNASFRASLRPPRWSGWGATRGPRRPSTTRTAEGRRATSSWPAGTRCQMPRRRRRPSAAAATEVLAGSPASRLSAAPVRYTI